MEKKMNLKKQTLVIALALITALTATSFRVSGQNKQEASDLSNARERTIEGVWRTVVTPRNCQTGDPIPNVPPISGLFTFNKGGTMAEYGIALGQTPALRSPGHGLWQREQGWQDYSFKFIFNRYNTTGVFIGSQIVRGVLELGASGDSFTTSSSIQILDAGDNVIGNGCATAVGTRFE
jgi:hypothetical protein